MKKNLPLVSVIVPCYNHEQYVKECIESIINQTYQNIELIVIDDGSSDNSQKILKELSDKYNFYFEHQRNIGLPATLNKALKFAKGKYICNLASDDYWPLHKVALQVNQMELNPNVSVSFGLHQEVSVDGKLGRVSKKKCKSRKIFKELLTQSFSIPASTAVIRADVFGEVGKYDENLPIEDYYMWLKIAKEHEFLYIDEILGYYRNVPDSLSKNIRAQVNATETILKLWEKSCYYEEAIYRQNILTFMRLSRDYKKDAFSYFLKSLRLRSFADLSFYKGIIRWIFT